MQREWVLLRHTAEGNAVVNRSAARDARWQAWFRRCVTTIIMFMIAYVSVALWAMRGDVAAASEQLRLSTLASVIGLVLLGLALRLIRWQYYARRLNWHFPLNHSVVAFLASLAFTATPGKAGEAIRLVLLRMHHDVSVSAGVGVLLVERLGDVIAVFMLSLASLSLIGGAGIYLILVVVPVTTLALFVCNSRIHGPLLARLARIRGLAGITNRAAQSLDACQRLLTPFPFLIGLGLAVIAWSCEALAFYHLARSVGIEVGPMQASSIYGTATLAGVLSALPGGVGGFELVMVMLLNRLGVMVAAATLPVMVFRLCTLWFGILLGVMFMLVWMLFIRPAGRPTPAESGGA